ncbi:MAG: type II toxin-antitoxin system RelB/DinJ family antitoxin [Alphaproteobacteria bacterium]|nr:type II toxin-antitoxin system RelB/DinJ family antitoxin [Alphaproteobacteria bacterium]
MAATTDTLQIRVSSDLKAQADMVFSSIGLKTSEAVRLFLQQSVNSNGLPFQLTARVPNAETLQAFRDSDEGRVEEVTLAQLKKRMFRKAKK